MSVKLPHFIIIGSAKSGTSSLYNELNEHPNIFMSPIKEPCFFDENVSWSKGIGWYASLFDAAEDGMVCGEASTNYTRYPQVDNVPQKMAAALPDVKLIYIMRNPVNRAYSHFVHRWSKELHPGKPFEASFTEFVKEDPMCLDSGKYAIQIQEYLEYFPKDRFFFIVFEEFIANKYEIMKNLYSFLGVEAPENIGGDAAKANVNRQFRQHVTRKKVMEKYEQGVLYKVLKKALPKEIKDRIYKICLSQTKGAKRIARAYEPPPLTGEEKKWLYDFYRPYNQQLSDEFGVNTAHWKIM